ncbi:MAG: Hsp20/alpha crystallin family protein [Gemmataceae bacterium]|nr:Hsp20/alpha crystallin family protein [Gemmataceae bacterium]
MFSLMPRRERGMMTRSPLEWFHREFAPLFERMFPVFPFEALWEPRWGFEAEELENEYVVRAEVPGFEASELEVTIAGNVLTFRAEHRRPEKEPAVERPYARLERTLTLPPGLNLEAVEARYHNGILEVHIPRTPEVRPRRIEVKA